VSLAAIAAFHGEINHKSTRSESMQNHNFPLGSCFFNPVYHTSKMVKLKNPSRLASSTNIFKGRGLQPVEAERGVWAVYYKQIRKSEQRSSS